MDKKTVKELEKKLKASEEYYWGQVQQEQQKNVKLQAELKKRDGDLKNLRREFSSAKRVLADRNKEISKFSTYAELETLKDEFENLMKWRGSVRIGGVEFEFRMTADGAKLRTKRDVMHDPSSMWWDDIPERATKLKDIANEALKKEKELAEHRSRLETVGEIVKSLYGLLPKEPKEEPEPEEKTEEEGGGSG